MLYQYICHISGLTVILRNKLKIESIPLSVVFDRSTMASSNGTVRRHDDPNLSTEVDAVDHVRGLQPRSTWRNDRERGRTFAVCL